MPNDKTKIMTDISKTPRLYTETRLAADGQAELNAGQAHYLKSVLRMDTGEHIRAFNPTDGEWIATITDLSKKSATIAPKEQTRTPTEAVPLRLLFPPIKKHRMDFLIEKSVELGVTELYPVITNRTQMRKINVDRIQAQIIEAAEQCERLDIPQLHPLQKLDTVIRQWAYGPVLCALERDDQAANYHGEREGSAFLIGPEGGFDDEERRNLHENKHIIPISLGPRILRAETAALYCLSNFSNK